MIAENQMYIGTTTGCFLICDALDNMVPRMSIRCYDDFIDTIVPLRMIVSRNNEESSKKLVLTCGRKCLEAGIRNIDRTKQVCDNETTILVWTH